MFGLKTRRSVRSASGSTRGLKGILNLFAGRRTSRSDIPHSTVAPIRSRGRMTVSGILREVLRHRRAK